MARRSKLGGGVFVLLLMCLVTAWLLLGKSEWNLPLAPQLQSLRKFVTAKAAAPPRMAKLPGIYLWAWERPEDLRFLGERRIGVAFLAKTIYLKRSKSPNET